MASSPLQQPFQLTKTPHGCSFVSPTGEIKRITHAGEIVYEAPSTINSLTLCAPRQEAKLLIKAMFKSLGVQDGSKARMVFCNSSPLFGDDCENLTALRFSSRGPHWPPIVDVQNNPSPPSFKLLKGYHVRCAALARKSQGIVFVS